MASDPGYGVRIIPLNATAGAYTVILATRTSRRIEIIEDASSGATGQGLTYQLPVFNSDNPSVWTWGPTLEIYPQSEPIILGNTFSEAGGGGFIVAQGPNTIAGIGVTPAQPIINIKSSGTAVNVRVTEFS